jgi:hypothetical protein
VKWSDQAQPVTVSTSPLRRTIVPLSTQTYQVTTATDAGGCSMTIGGAAVVTVKPPAPTSVAATATSTTQVQLTWAFSGTADRFDVYRGAVKIGQATSMTYTDTTVAANTSYVYSVTAIKSETPSSSSSPDLATTVLFNDPLVPGVAIVSAAPIMEVRTAINIVRIAAGLPAATFTDASLAGKEAEEYHLTELRTALAEARARLGLAPITYVRPGLAAGELIMAVDVAELRGGVK